MIVSRHTLCAGSEPNSAYTDHMVLMFGRVCGVAVDGQPNGVIQRCFRNSRDVDAGGPYTRAASPPSAVHKSTKDDRKRVTA